MIITKMMSFFKVFIFHHKNIHVLQIVNVLNRVCKFYTILNNGFSTCFDVSTGCFLRNENKIGNSVKTVHYIFNNQNSES